MDPEMTSEQNLDEDILQCRAEILQALGQEPEEGKAGASEHLPEKADAAISEDSPQPAEVQIENADTEPNEGLIEDWEFEEENANSDSFEDLLMSEEDSHEEEDSPEEENLPESKDSEPVTSDPEPPAKIDPPKTPAAHGNPEQYNRILKALMMQKNNLSATCKDQEQHISELVSQVEQTGLQFQEAQQKITDLTAQINKLSEIQESSDQVKEELKKTVTETKRLQRDLADLQQRHQETLKEKNEQADSLLERAAECSSITSNLNRTKAALAEQTQKNQSLMQRIHELEQEVSQQKTQLDRLKPLEQQKEAQDQDIQSLREKIQNLHKTTEQLNQKLDLDRQEKDSLRQQVFSLEQALSRQQTDARQSITSLKEELIGKEQHLQDLQAQYDKLSEQFLESQAQMQALQQTAQSQPAVGPDPSDLLMHDQEPEPEEEREEEEALTPQRISVQADDLVPQFDLTDQILFSQRRQNSSRRLPPSHGRTTPTENIRKVVHQFVAPSPEARDRSTPPRETFTKPPLRDTETEPADRRSKDFRQPLIADIVRKDIENFCRQNQWIFIEFPSG